MDANPLAVNKELSDILTLLASYYTMDRDAYRAKAFSSAASGVAQYDKPILSGAQAAKDIPGVGKSSAEIIDEYLRTGAVQRLQALEQKHTDRKQVTDYFRSFYGIGPATANRYYDQGLRTLEDLWTRGNLTEAQQLGIMWRDHIDLRIPRPEMDTINAEIGKILNPYGIRWNISGSYRRQEPSSGDIDVLVESRPDLNMDGLMSLLQPLIAAKLAQGPTKFMGMIRLSPDHNGHRIDIRLVTPEHYASSLLYFTGSKEFNILMRLRAHDFGYELSEDGIVDAQRNVIGPINTEEDIFNILRVKYLAPVDRIKGLQTLTYI